MKDNTKVFLKAITNAENKEFRQLYSKKIKQLMNKLNFVLTKVE